jgi:hypothetical protein
MEYRVKESCGMFYVQVKVKRTKGILFWKKEYHEWVGCDLYGGEACVEFISDILHPFNTLIEAKDQIKAFMKPDTFHYMDDNRPSYDPTYIKEDLYETDEAKIKLMIDNLDSNNVKLMYGSGPYPVSFSFHKAFVNRNLNIENLPTIEEVIKINVNDYLKYSKFAK